MPKLNKRAEGNSAGRRTVSSKAKTMSKGGAEENDVKTPQSALRRPKPASGQAKNPVRIVSLGGVGEIGKNITLYEYGDDMMIVDCGMAFPDEEMPGVDIVLPDLSYVYKNKDKIKGLVLTHGHEDHIGALPYLLKQMNVPVYGTKLTLGLVEGKLKEHGLSRSANLNIVKPGDVITLGCFSVEIIHVNHSIPDAVALAIKTPIGRIIQTGDFKIDTTPIDGSVLDIARLSHLGRQGVLLLLSDSTNAERPGFAQTERTVGESFSALFKKGDDKRIIIASFSSNIHRIQQIVDEAVRNGRKVVVSGRSMINVVNISTELGYLKVPDGVLIDIDMIRKYPPEKLVIVTTGSQGEPLSALRRMAFGDHKKVNIGPGDMIIISATPIPGNEKFVTRVVNELLKLGAQVVYEKMYEVHVSGHACQEELKLMLSMTNPKFFIPVHGEYKHLIKHAELARGMGIDPNRIIIPEVGKVMELTKNSLKVTSIVQSGRVLVDGLGVGDVGSIVLRDRKHLAEDGLIVVVMTIDTASKEVVAGPDLVSRGFVYVKESEELLEEARSLTCSVLDDCKGLNIRDWASIKTKVRDELSKYLYEQTKRRPMILPIIMEI